MARGRGLARQVRTGLAVNGIPKQMEESPLDYLDELWFRKPIRKHLSEFAVVFALIFTLIGGFVVYNNGLVIRSIYWFGGSLFLLFLGFYFPHALHPFWKGWMKFAHVLNKFVTGIILSFMWIVVLVPIAFLLKIIGKKVMDLSYDPSVETYWEEREAKLHDFKLIERQF